MGVSTVDRNHLTLPSCVLQRADYSQSPDAPTTIPTIQTQERLSLELRKNLPEKCPMNINDYTLDESNRNGPSKLPNGC